MLSIGAIYGGNLKKDKTSGNQQKIAGIGGLK